MHLGFFSMPLHRPGKPWGQALAEDREAVILADRLGFTEAWIGEHFTTKVEQIPSPLIFLATLIEATRNIRLGTGVVNLPHHHPVALAGEAALFDQLSGGRLMLGIGPGGLVSDAEMFGHEDLAERNRMLMDGIDIVLSLWRDEPPYRIDSPYWPLKLDEAVWPRHGLGLMPKPLQQPHPPIAMALVSPNSSSARAVARRGWIPISANFIPAADAATHWPLYAAEREAMGQRPDPSIWRVARNILVTESDSQAADILADPDGVFAFYFRYLRSLRQLPELADKHDAPVAELNALLDVPGAVAEMVIAGTAETVLAKLCALRETVGDFGTLLLAGHDWEDAALNRASMRRLAEDVMPRFTRHMTGLRAAE